LDFQTFSYGVEINEEYEKRKITKPYSENLTPQEFTDFSKIFVKEALAQIKTRTGK